MKKIILSLIIITLSNNILMAQNFAYPQGDIQFVVDDQFGKVMNWDTFLYPEKRLSESNYKKYFSFTIDHDNNIYLINNLQRKLYFIDKEVKQAKVLSNLVDRRILNRETISGILDNKYIISTNNDQIQIRHLNGKLFKTLQLDYSVIQAVPLSDNIIAISAFTVYSGRRIKNVIILKDIITEKEEQIEYNFDQSKNRTYTIKSEKGSIGINYPYSRKNYFIDRINNNQLLVGFSHDPSLKIYSKEGKLLTTIPTNIEALKVSASVKAEFIQHLEKSIKRLGYEEAYKEKPMDDSLIPDYMPFFNAIQVDDNNNILVFIYTNDESTNTARIYSFTDNKWKYQTTSRFIFPDETLTVNPIAKCTYFGKNDIYTIVKDTTQFNGSFKIIKLTLKKE